MQNNGHFLVDTSVWLFALRKDFIPKIKDRIDSLLKVSQPSEPSFAFMMEVSDENRFRSIQGKVSDFLTY